MDIAGLIQDTTTYDAIGRDTGDATPLGQFNTAYLGETGQVATVTALGQSISGSPASVGRKSAAPSAIFTGVLPCRTAPRHDPAKPRGAAIKDGGRRFAFPPYACSFSCNRLMEQGFKMRRINRIRTAAQPRP